MERNYVEIPLSIYNTINDILYIIGKRYSYLAGYFFTLPDGEHCAAKTVFQSVLPQQAEELNLSYVSCLYYLYVIYLYLISPKYLNFKK